MENLKKELFETEEKQEYERIKALIKDAEKRYKAARYKDTRVYSTNVSIWKKSFIKHLSLRDFDNPERGARMAIDVILPFKKKSVPLLLLHIFPKENQSENCLRPSNTTLE